MSRQPAADRRREDGPGWDWRGLFSRSLLPRIMVAFAVALAAGAGVTYLLDVRLTRRALTSQATELLHRDVTTLQTRLATSQSAMLTDIRSAAETLSLKGLTRPDRHSSLVQAISALRLDLDLDAVVVLDDGVVRAAVGESLEPPAARSTAELLDGPPARLVPTADGGLARAALAPVGFGPEQALLVGARSFGNAAAFELRALIGQEVILASEGRLVGTTLARPGAVPRPPSQPPEQPRLVTIEDSESFVHYARVARGGDPWSAGGLVGVLVPEPVAELDRELTQSRLLGVGLLVLVATLLGALLFARLSRPIMDLAGTARRIADGELDARFAARTHDEVGFLAEALEDMRRAARGRLELIREQTRALERTSRRIVEAQDEERRRLARDLHDGVQQRLVALKVKANAVRERLREEPQSLDDAIDELAGDVDTTLEDLRGTAQDIYPSILRDRGLEGALHSLAGRCPIPLEVSLSPEPLPRIDETVETSTYHLISEALTNAVKHGDAARAAVEVRLADQQLLVTVRDEGRGFEPDAVEDPGGLVHMEDRAAALGGELTVTAEPGAGTTVHARLPIRG